jgi:predicted regulator of Ras-like GTPase activity (Roadblock/LC7/MglB family)
VAQRAALPLGPHRRFEVGVTLTQTVDSTLSAFRSEVSDYRGSGLVDLSTGMLLDADCADEAPGEVLDMLAAAVTELFRGRAVGRLLDTWSRHGVDAAPQLGFHEVVLTGTDHVTVLLRSRMRPDLVAVVVCRSGVNLGMLLAQARQVVRGLDAE